MKIVSIIRWFIMFLYHIGYVAFVGFGLLHWLGVQLEGTRFGQWFGWFFAAGPFMVVFFANLLNIVFFIREIRAKKKWGWWTESKVVVFLLIPIYGLIVYKRYYSELQCLREESR